MKRYLALCLIALTPHSGSGPIALRAPPASSDVSQRVDVTIEISPATYRLTTTAADEATFTPIPAKFNLEFVAATFLYPRSHTRIGQLQPTVRTITSAERARWIAQDEGRVLCHRARQ